MLQNTSDKSVFDLPSDKVLDWLKKITDFSCDIPFFIRFGIIILILFFGVICFLRANNGIIEEDALKVGGVKTVDRLKRFGVSAHEISHTIFYIIGLFRIVSIRLYIPFRERKTAYDAAAARIDSSNKTEKQKRFEKSHLPIYEGQVSASPTIFRFYQDGMTLFIGTAPIFLIPVFVSFLESLLWNGGPQSFYSFTNLGNLSNFLNFSLPLFLSNSFSIKSVLIFIIMSIVGAVFCFGIYPGKTDLSVINWIAVFFWIVILEIIFNIFKLHDTVGLFIWNCIGWMLRGIIICTIGQLLLYTTLKIIYSKQKRHQEDGSKEFQQEGQVSQDKRKFRNLFFLSSLFKKNQKADISFDEIEEYNRTHDKYHEN